MEIKLHNTLTGKKEVFVPINANHVGIYSCGPTVYGHAHIGNFRTFIFGDLLRRMFEYNGYSVNQVMNITDVDDKTIRKSQQEKVSLSAVTRKYEDLFLADLQLLNILPATKTPRATESVEDMIDLIGKLLDKGIAYKTSDGIYFDISKSGNYGELAHLDKQTTKKERVANDEYDKENAQDFALWKLYSPEDGEVYFDAPFGRGRPGWHIECSAMSMKNIGKTIDVHTGGIDLIFPHHTNEIAQSEAGTGERFVNYWMHGEFITVDGKKMSKSLNNVFTLKDILAKGIDPLAFRYLTLGAHYRSPLNFTWESLASAQTALNKLKEFVSRLNLDMSKVALDTSNTEQKIFDGYKKEFLENINDDLNTPKALALVWQIVKDKEVNAKTKLELILDFDQVLGLSLGESSENSPRSDLGEIPDEVRRLAEERQNARVQKDWQTSDDLRDQIAKLGFEIKDTPEGYEIKKNF